MSLANLRCLITRPLPQAKVLADLISQHHGIPIIFPTLAIFPIDDSTINQHLLTKINNLDLMIFTSAFAVEYSVDYLKNNLPINLLVAAIGKATAKKLEECGISVAIIPENCSSEGLLTHPALKFIHNKKIAIIKGKGGRDLLIEELKQRQASVVCYDVYERRCPTTDISPVLRSGLDIIISTSNESLQNLLHLTPKDKQQDLLNIPLLVISKRMQIFAKKLGFAKIIVAKEASNEGIIAKLAKRKR